MGIKAPPKYVHPRKRENDETIPNTADGELVEKTRSPIKKKRSTVPDLETASAPNVRTADCSEVIRLVARVPKSGEVAKFDQMTKAGVPEKDALLGLMKHGLSAAIASGKIAARAYNHDQQAYETNRSIPSDLLDKFREKLDPFNLLTKRALGIKIGEALICQANQGQDDV